MKTIWVALAVMGLAAAPAAAQSYVGAGKCKVCHNKEEVGNQHGKWQSTKHAKAFATLSTPAAKETAKKLGVADPTTDIKCLICHTTGAESGGGVKAAEGVSCEACHGPGEKYKSKEVHGTDRNAGIAAGMIDTKAKGEAVCKRCHVPEYKGHKNPNYKPFNYKEFQAKIAHPSKKK
jgi:hypothetical protein